MMLTSDDLPAPFGPITARISPRRTSRLTPFSARTPPKVSTMSRSVSAAAGAATTAGAKVSISPAAR